MTKIKTGLLVCGAAGLASCFVGDPSFWALHRVPGLALPITLTIVGFALVVIIGALAVTRPPMRRWHAAVALLGSLASLPLWIALGTLSGILRLAPLTHGPSFGTLLFAVGFYGGAVIAIAGLVKPERPRRI